MGKRVLMVVAPKDFRDEELFIPKEILEGAGHEVKVASISRTLATGALGGKIVPDFAAHEVNIDFFDAVIVVGGPGTHLLLNNEDVIKLVRKSSDAGKIVGGICLAPTVLAKAGILVDKNATVFKTDESLTLLKTNGAVYKPEPVVVDGKVITANGPSSAEEFGKKIVELLENQEGESRGN